MSVTIKDVAELAGVSVGTVSKVLNNTGNVKPRLKMRVQAVVDSIGYRPSTVARNFKRQKTNIIGLIIPRILSQFYVELVHHIERRIKDQGYTLFLANTDEDVETEIKDLRTFTNLRVDGLIIASSSERGDSRITHELSAFDTLGIPVVVAARRIEGYTQDMVAVDYEHGGYTTTSYLVQEGHRIIGVLAAPGHTSAGLDLLDGYQRALHEHEIPYDRSLFYFGDKNPNNDYGHIRDMVGREINPPSAIIVASSFRLVGVLRALRAHRKCIPDDVSVICFGDADWFEYLSPPLTVATVSAEEVGRHALEMLFERIHNGVDIPPRAVLTRPMLKLRNSVRNRNAST